MKKTAKIGTEEKWNVKEVNGAFYTLERSGHLLDFMKVGVPRALLPGEIVKVIRVDGLRYIN